MSLGFWHDIDWCCGFQCAWVSCFCYVGLHFLLSGVLILFSVVVQKLPWELIKLKGGIASRNSSAFSFLLVPWFFFLIYQFRASPSPWSHLIVLLALQSLGHHMHVDPGHVVVVGRQSFTTGVHGKAPLLREAHKRSQPMRKSTWVVSVCTSHGFLKDSASFPSPHLSHVPDVNSSCCRRRLAGNQHPLWRRRRIVHVVQLAAFEQQHICFIKYMFVQNKILSLYGR